ncbi:helix-hairpin-helix domain-containing protein [Kitasatospora sp. NPDC094028]
MTTLGLGAAKKRHVIDETVRLRMAALLPERGTGAGPAEPVVPVEPVTQAEPVVSAEPVVPVDPVMPLDPVGVADRPGGVGARLRFASALALDRRAVAGLGILLLFAVGYAVQHFWLGRPEAVAVPALTAASVPAAGVSAGTAAEAGPALGPGAVPGVAAGAAAGAGPPEGSASSAEVAVVVDVGGRVRSPGLHVLPGGSRVADAVRAAGGALPETDTRSLNLARVLTDGEQIVVGDPAPAPALAAAPASGAGPPGAVAPRPPVSLNRATLEQLDTLPGVGPTLAQRILAYRVSHGSFRSVDQLRQVSGIGARTFAELRPLLTL